MSNSFTLLGSIQGGSFTREELKEALWLLRICGN